jgi:KUP system potassium uptake protein
VILGLIGAALFYGDSMITPAISVLSAVEGLELAFEGLERWVVPLALLVLVALFLIQKHGTDRIGKLFGPVMVLWFVVLGVRANGIVQHPEVLSALNPMWGVRFFMVHPGGLPSCGAVVLALTGAEALYADMGHFGRKPIARAWFALVLPALVLNYFGQGALLLENPERGTQPVLPAGAACAIPLVVLATLATVIASRGDLRAFSLTRQAIQLGYIPRMHIQHTSSAEQGQIYIGAVNWALMVGDPAGAGFESGALACLWRGGTGTMLITSILVSAVMLLLWKWPPGAGGANPGGLSAGGRAVLAANVPKIIQGGAFPVLAGIVVCPDDHLEARQRVAGGSAGRGRPAAADFHQQHRRTTTASCSGHRRPSTARLTPCAHALLHNLLHNRCARAVVLLTVVHARTYPACAVITTVRGRRLW